MKPDRRDFFAQRSGVAVLATMTHEARADVLQLYLMAAAAPPTAASQGSPASAPTSMAADERPFHSNAKVEAQIETQPRRRGVGNLFTTAEGNVRHLPPMPAKPTLVDYLQRGRPKSPSRCAITRRCTSSTTRNTATNIRNCTDACSRRLHTGAVHRAGVADAQIVRSGITG
jgi:hypothetical protein